MPTVSTFVEVDLDDFDDDDLITELEQRGYLVSSEETDPDNLLAEMIWRYKNGYIEDAMLLLERRFSEMHGISKRIK